MLILALYGVRPAAPVANRELMSCLGHQGTPYGVERFLGARGVRATGLGHIRAPTSPLAAENFGAGANQPDRIEALRQILGDPDDDRRLAVVARDDGKAAIVVGVTQDLTQRFDAVGLVRAGAEILGGKGGGGRPDMAQAGGPDAARAEEALDAVRRALVAQAGH